MVYTWNLWVVTSLCPCFEFHVLSQPFQDQIISTENIFLPDVVYEVWKGHSL